MGGTEFLNSIAEATEEADEAGVVAADAEGAQDATQVLDEAPAADDAADGDAPAEGVIEVAGRKYNSVEDALKQFEEDARYIGTLKNEVGDLRKYREEVDAYLAQQQAQQQSVAPPSANQIEAYFSQVAETNPNVAYQEAVGAFGESVTSGDTKTARAIIRSVRKFIDEDAADELQDVLDDYRVQQAQAPALEMQQMSQLEYALDQAWNSTIAEKPEAVQYAPQIQEIIQSGVVNLGSGSAQELKAAAIAAYEIAIARDTDRVVQQRVNAQRTTEGDQAAASSLSGSRAAPAADDAATEADKIFDGILNAHRAVY